MPTRSELWAAVFLVAALLFCSGCITINNHYWDCHFTVPVKVAPSFDGLNFKDLLKAPSPVPTPRRPTS